MNPLPFAWPWWLPFWSVFVWAFWPEFQIFQRSRKPATEADSPDAGSLRVIQLGMSVATVTVFPIAWVRTLRFPPALDIPVFLVGVATLIAGSLLRRHCWRLLGSSFTGDVRVRPGQRIVGEGAYRLLRHPSYTAGILMNVGIGLSLGSWGSTALIVLISFAVYCYRMAVEERALLAVLGEPYREFLRHRKRIIPYVFCGTGLLALALVAMACAVSSNARQIPHTQPADAPAPAARQRFLEMFARAYFPGRTGQLMIVPREGDFITRPDPDVTYMHGSPWAYDVEIPMMFVGPAVKTGAYSTPAVQQDVAPTIAAALGVSMPPTATGHALPIFHTDFARPRVAFVLVLDGMRRDYFDRYADVMPTLSALRRRAAWFSQAQVNFLPTNTPVGHSTIATGADPRIHGVTGVNFYDRIHRRRQELFAGLAPQVLMALTLADVWQLDTSGRAIVLAQGSIDRAAAPLAGHGACQPNGAPVVLVSYDETTGGWHSNPDCFRLPDYLKDRNASTLWSAESEWLHHKIDSPAAVRRSALFPAFEADAMIAMIEHEPLGEDSVADLLLMNYKGADFVGHRDGPDSNEVRLTLGEMDRNLARIISALEAKVGKDYLLAVTADHGMPSAPPERRHLAPELVDRMHQKFDPQAKQLVTGYEPENAQMFVDEDRLSHLGLTMNDLARFLEAQPYIFAAFTQDEVRRAADAPGL